MTTTNERRDQRTSPRGSEAIEELQSSLYGALPIYEHIEARVLGLEPRVRCAVPLKRKNQNHFGAVHAALQFAACEMAGALAVSQHPMVRADDLRIVVQSMNIDFVRPAMTGVEAIAAVSEAQARALNDSLALDGRARLELEVELADSGGNLVAKATGHYHLSRKPRSAN